MQLIRGKCRNTRRYHKKNHKILVGASFITSCRTYASFRNFKLEKIQLHQRFCQHISNRDTAIFPLNYAKCIAREPELLTDIFDVNSNRNRIQKQKVFKFSQKKSRRCIMSVLEGIQMCFFVVGSHIEIFRSLKSHAVWQFVESRNLKSTGERI